MIPGCCSIDDNDYSRAIARDSCSIEVNIMVIGEIHKQVQSTSSRDGRMLHAPPDMVESSRYQQLIVESRGLHGSDTFWVLLAILKLWILITVLIRSNRSI